METKDPIYIFIGHGWSTDRTFLLPENGNMKIVMLQDDVCLMERSDTKHAKNLSRIGYGGYTASDYLKDLHVMTSVKIKNKFCVYNSDYRSVPDLLLTTHTKGDDSRFQKLGNLRATKLGIHVLLLSELVDILIQKHGLNFSLIVHACRSTLDVFQLENLEIFGPKGRSDLVGFIQKNNINVLSNDAKISSPPCSPYSGTL